MAKVVDSLRSLNYYRNCTDHFDKKLNLQYEDEKILTSIEDGKQDNSNTSKYMYKLPRFNIATLLVSLLLFIVFIILPIVYLVHCFDIVYSSHREDEWNLIMKDHTHFNPSHAKHAEKSEQALSTNTIFPNILHNPPAQLEPNDACSDLPDNLKFDCHPEQGASADSCNSRRCCWFPKETNASKISIPFCYYPINYPGYRITETIPTKNGYDVIFERSVLSPYQDDVKQIRMRVRFETQYRLHVKILDESGCPHYEPAYPEIPVFNQGTETPDYDIQFDSAKSGFRVLRNSTKEILFDALDIGSLIFSNQFLQISALLPTDNIYGLGQHRSTLKLSNNWQNYIMFNRDQPPRENTNLYGSHPFYISMEKSGLSHGVFLLNSNAMDVILQPGPAITFRPIGGYFDFYFFLGPGPNEVIQQYTELIGRPVLPPFWSLGFHLCRYGYGDLENTKSTLERNVKAGIPIDTQWNDLDYMENGNDFTFDLNTFKKLPDFVKSLHDNGRHYVILIDPGISAGEPRGTYLPFDEGVKEDIFIKDNEGNLLIGKVWNPVSTVWPDFTNPKTHYYWKNQLKNFHNNIPFDGAWIDMNDPSNFWDGSGKGCPSTSLDYPQYAPFVEGGKLWSKTVCMSAQHHAGRHYDIHNIYAFAETIATYKAMAEIRGVRPFIITRSSFPGIGKYTGVWSGDIYSSWYDMAKTIPDTIFFNMFGIPFTGSDICGFNGDTTKELCQRWMQLGAFYPFSRNHNSIDMKEQDPVALGPEVVESSKKALSIRYSLLPFLYTLLANAHMYGDTVVRPLFFEFPNDSQTYSLDAQMMWGSALLIIPILSEGKTSVSLYLPAANWYDWYSLAHIKESSEEKGTYVTLPAPKDTIPLLLRGGNIVPMQKPNITTSAQRSSSFDLLVIPNQSGSAKGSLFWDDGESLATIENGKYDLFIFSLNNSRLIGRREHIFEHPFSLPLNKVTVLGIETPVTSVLINEASAPFTYNTINKFLVIDHLNLSLSSDFSITWI